ncbi:plasmid recombination protein [Leuconostoc mesenteroides]|uniref:plasmid recombination protein n=1 Tax=Leuconostoc mesenteroides TaxID=1245 RepID=UPI001CBF3327|nr:plasmid recombination protein [Leuconostoc mesenteroides]MBZ1512774.1 plasmid recombination protein [Leuconostoc mesenteroides]
MAHLKKNTRGSVPGLAVHFERKTDHHTNKEIDVSKSYLNQELMADGSDMLSRFNARLNDVYCMKRDDVKALATWIVSLPEELTQNKKVAQSWLKTLTTAREDPDTKIAPTRLDRGIEQVKALINRIIELTRDLFKGPSL